MYRYSSNGVYYARVKNKDKLIHRGRRQKTINVSAQRFAFSGLWDLYGVELEDCRGAGVDVKFAVDVLEMPADCAGG